MILQLYDRGGRTMSAIVIIGGGITGTAAADALAREGHAVTLIEQERHRRDGIRPDARRRAPIGTSSGRTAARARGGRAVGRSERNARRRRRLPSRRQPAARAHARRGRRHPRHRRRASERRVSTSTSCPTTARCARWRPRYRANVLAASYCATDGHADPVKATQRFADSARRHGALDPRRRRRPGHRASPTIASRVSMTTAGAIPAERVIVAAGIDTPALLRPLGLDLPLSIEVVAVVQSEPLPPSLDQVFGVANADCAGRQEVGGRLALHRRRLDGRARGRASLRRTEVRRPGRAGGACAADRRAGQGLRAHGPASSISRRTRCP